MHLCFVPLAEDKRLCAKEILGNKKKLTWWQDEYWKHMVEKHPELERGESASRTGRDHIPPRVFKEIIRLTKQREKLEGLLEGMNPFNAKSRASEIGKVLDIYIPAVEKMQTQCDKYQVTFTKTATANKKLRKKNSQLKESLENAQEKSVLKKLQDNQLRKDYEAAVSTLDRIPQEVLELYMNGNQKRREKPIEKVL